MTNTSYDPPLKERMAYDVADKYFYQIEIAQERLNKLVEIFGDDLFVEIMPIDMPEQEIMNRSMVDIAARNGIPLVATNDCHYIEKEDAKSHDVLLAIQQKRKLDDPDIWLFDARDLYMKTREEMEESFRTIHPYIPESVYSEALDNTMIIADRCNYQMPKYEQRLPNLDVEVYPDYKEFKQWEEEGSILGLDDFQAQAEKVLKDKEAEEKEAVKN
jgi:DNA polymerase-3 subunit alpha